MTSAADEAVGQSGIPYFKINTYIQQFQPPDIPNIPGFERFIRPSPPPSFTSRSTSNQLHNTQVFSCRNITKSTSPSKKKTNTLINKGARNMPGSLTSSHSSRTSTRSSRFVWPFSLHSASKLDQYRMPNFNSTSRRSASRTSSTATSLDTNGSARAPARLC
ncbi:hypothetical protein M426DRAFT_320197 [Hypoxylon sp. CI-4A]|nr:hypothetical protein M426DRAFT_320197 [Hypoxylon sp. CI-4A]